MIMSVEEFRNHITTDKTDEWLSSKLAAIELSIRKYTNNNFQNRNFRFKCDVSSVNGLEYASNLFAVNDTVQLTNSHLNAGIYTITSIDIDNACMGLNEALYEEEDVLVTKVIYPEDVKQGVINLMKWDMENRDKVGIQSETISRHSVTYFNMDGDNSVIGYPKSLVGFLKPYIKARF